MTYEDLDTAVSDILTDANKKVETLIEKFGDQTRLILIIPEEIELIEA